MLAEIGLGSASIDSGARQNEVVSRLSLGIAPWEAFRSPSDTERLGPGEGLRLAEMSGSEGRGRRDRGRLGCCDGASRLMGEQGHVGGVAGTDGRGRTRRGRGASAGDGGRRRRREPDASDATEARDERVAMLLDEPGRDNDMDGRGLCDTSPMGEDKSRVRTGKSVIAQKLVEGRGRRKARPAGECCVLYKHCSPEVNESTAINQLTISSRIKHGRLPDGEIP